MEIAPEVIDIGSLNSDSNVVELKRSVSYDDELDTDNIQYNRQPSVNFGSGIELLMNDKKKSENTKSSEISPSFGSIFDQGFRQYGFIGDNK